MLSPTQLADLAAWLRLSGYVVTSAQLIAAARILHGKQPLRGYAELAPYLAPIFCSDAQTQQRFAGEYAKWLAHWGLVQQRAVQQGNLQQQSDVAPAHSLTKKHARIPTLTTPRWRSVCQQTQAAFQQMRWSKSVCLALVLCLALWLAFWVEGSRPPNEQAADSASTKVLAGIEESSPKLLALSPSGQSTSTTSQSLAALGSEAKIFGFSSLLFLWALAAWLVQRASHRWGFFTLLGIFLAYALYQFPWTMVLLCAGPSLALLRIIYAYNRQVFFHSLPAHTLRESSMALDFASQPSALFGDEVKVLGPALRQRQRVSTRELDLDASIRATIRAGGVTKPVFGSQREPAYLVLVDSSCQLDHAAQLFHTLLQALHAQGVQLVRYQFEGELRQLRHLPFAGEVLRAGPHSLAQLALQQEEMRLLLCSDGAALIDRYTGRVSAQLAFLAKLPTVDKPILLTSQLRWGVREWLLAHAGLHLLPLAELSQLGQFYGAHAELSSVAHDAKKRLGAIYLHNQDVWLDRVAPSKDELAALLQALQDDLGQAGFAWLAACAVYPEIHCQMTLALGERLCCTKDEASPAAWKFMHRQQQRTSLLQLVILPWLRHAFMPRWLRQALLAKVQPDCHRFIKQQVAQVLQTLVLAQVTIQATSTSALQLHTTLSPWRRLWSGTLAVGAGNKGDDLPQAAHDQVFVHFMAGPHMVVKTLISPNVGWPARLPLAAPRGGASLLGFFLVLAVALQVAGRLPPTEEISRVAATNKLDIASAASSASQTIARTPKASAAEKSCDYCPEMLILPSGQFRMGDDKNKNEDEKPAHPVQVASFAIGKYEVTQAQWRAVMGENPSYFKDCGDNCPVENISWEDMQEYLAKLNAKTGLQYRLPSEAEWEYAARAGSQSQWSHGDDEAQLQQYAWYGNNSGGKTHKVGTLKPNAFGLYDMHGNVWEWVASYQGAPNNGTVWLKSYDKDKIRVLRGGSWNFNAANSRAAIRGSGRPVFRNVVVGFRVARTLP